MLGGNFLSKMDVEYDLAHGSVKLLKTSLGCRLNSLAYWGKAGERYSVMDIERTDKSSPHTIGTAYLNGNPTRAWFNTGSAGTVVSLAAAERVGVKPGDPGVQKVNFGTKEDPSGQGFESPGVVVGCRGGGVVGGITGGVIANI